MKILILSRYSSEGPSSRIRLYNYLPYFKDSGWDITIKPLLGKEYIEYLYEDKPIPLIHIIKQYCNRILTLLNKNEFDLIWLQQEAFPWLPGWFEKLLFKSQTPVVVDYDDASFHRYDMHNNKAIKKFLGKKIDVIMNLADIVLAGNQYLAERAKSNKVKRIELIPTVIDINNYRSKNQFNDNIFTIGWVGSPATSKYIYGIEDELRSFCKDGKSGFTIIGAKDIKLKGIPIKQIKWDSDTEVDEICKFDVGIMPLTDSPWERGKCGFKLIQYMACGVPVIASPVGVNSEIVQHGINGFLANNSDDWIKYLEILKNDVELRKKMGIAGRYLVEQNNTYQVTAPRIIRIFESVVNKRNISLRQ